MAPEEGAQRHADIAGLGQVGEEHLPEMLVALANEEEIDGRHGRVDRGDHPQARDHRAAARVAREQGEAADDEQLEPQERHIQAEPMEQDGGYLAPRGASGKPRHEEEAVGGQQEEVERDEAEGVGGQPDGARPVAHRRPKRDTKNSTRRPKVAELASAQMPMSAKKVHTPAIRRIRVGIEAGVAAAAAPRRCCSRRIET